MKLTRAKYGRQEDEVVFTKCATTTTTAKRQIPNIFSLAKFSEINEMRFS